VKYLGMDVHAKSTVWSLLDASGEVEREGSIGTTAPALAALVQELAREEPILAGQEVGTMSYLVHDALSAIGTNVLSFNAAQLRMIAASRKKTDRRDAFWIGKALASGMYPHPVYIPTGEIRELRALLTRRRMLQTERNRWQYRARAALRASGRTLRTGGHSLRRSLKGYLEVAIDLNAPLRETLALCQRQEASLALELRLVDAELRRKARASDAIKRLETIPAVGDLVATTIYAWVGEIDRFPDAKSLAAYAGLVPSVYQSAASQRSGGITKQGSKALRSALVQSAHVLTNRCRTAAARPLQEIGQRVRTSRGRRKIATVALARHLLRIAYYVLRDGTTYDPKRLRGRNQESAAA
jgi:transposase